MTVRTNNLDALATLRAEQRPSPKKMNGAPILKARDRLKIVIKPDPAPEFPIHALPDEIREACQALCEHVQAPTSLCAHTLLGTTALVTQGLGNILIPSLGVPKPICLFMLLVAVSGERKTTCDNLALQAIAERERELAHAYGEELRAYETVKRAYDAERRKIENNRKKDFTQQDRLDALNALGKEPEPPLAPILRAEEPNLEGLVNLLKHGQPSVGIFTSEGGQFLGGHGMTAETKMRTTTGLSKLWDSGTAQRVRAKEITSLEGRRVSISLAAQPRVASVLLQDEVARDQGFLARFLLAMPDSRIGTREVIVSDPLGDARLQTYHSQCRQILGVALPLKIGKRNELDPPVLRLTDGAWTLWQRFAQDVEKECGPSGQWHPIQASALKMGENVARIAAVFTLFGNPTASFVSEERMASAIEIGGFYLKEALRISGRELPNMDTQSVAELERWLATEWQDDDISPSLIQQFALYALRANADTTRRWILLLCDAGVLIPQDEPRMIRGKNYREAYRIIRLGGAA